MFQGVINYLLKKSGTYWIRWRKGGLLLKIWHRLILFMCDCCVTEFM
ncbi:hypothetical protein UUU_35620 [Klebsiella pneumoniae subsp. pneumoniae DSM 30104 = JCM 1662 = NBRC 14940]|nr:hypothetical protein UUU_35620 [Klebsiella pneumoniae subsp. pneumoniae DSM 30104 = JCM 1662 = NBRC 14940]